MLTRIATLALTAPRRILAAAILLFVVAGAFAISVIISLPSGGVDAPDSDSMRAEQVLDEKFGAGGYSLVFTITSDAGVDSPEATARGNAIVAALSESPHAVRVLSYWTSPRQLKIDALKGALVSSDGRTGLVAARIQGGDNAAARRAGDLAKPFLGTRDGVTVTAGGQAMAYSELEKHSKIDLVVMEAIAIPFSFLVMVWIFGSAVAAMIPIAVSLCAIAATGASLAVIHKFADLSIFAVNVAMAACLTIALDAALFIVNRYREESANGMPPDKALIRTMNTAGRTVTYSALTMALTMSAMLVFPQYLFRSLAYAGMIAYLVSLVGALLVAPALIVVLGDRINALDVRKPIRRLLGRSAPREREPEQRFWYRIAVFASRHAIAVVVAVTLVLLALGSPLLGMKLSMPDDRALPTSASARQTGDILRSQFGQNNLGTMQVVLPQGVKSPRDVTAYALALSKVDNVTMVAGPNGLYANGTVVSAATFDSALKGDAGYLSVFTTEDPFSDAGKDQLAALQEVPAPTVALFNGLAARDNDNAAAVLSRAPVAVALIALVTLFLMYMMTGSFVLPIKALIMNFMSLAAAFGVMIWIFQDGHLGAFGTTATGHTTTIIPPLLGIMAYALAMDYEVFVLSRIHEEWRKSGRTPVDNQRAVAIGLAHTGRLVTAAALVMVIVFLGIVAGQVSFMRALGLGWAVAVIVDAFLIRTFLVPAFMTLLGRANWWAPGPFARWHERRGLIEDERPKPTTPQAKAESAELMSD